MSSLVENFFEAINTISQHNVDMAKNDVTVDGEIRSLVNVDIGHYKVTYQGNSFDAYAQDPLTTYKVGEQVYVLVPQGDFSQRKVILGRSAYKNNSTFEDRQDMTNFYVDKGPNWMEAWYDFGTELPLQICAVKGQYKESLDHEAGANYYDFGFMRKPPEQRVAVNRYPVNYPDVDELKEADTMVQRYAKSYNAIKVSATFQTNFQNVHDTGKYALVVECIEKNMGFMTPAELQHPQFAERMGQAYYDALMAIAKFEKEFDEERYNTDPIYKDEQDKKRAELDANLAAAQPEQEEYKTVAFKLGFPTFSGAPYAYVSPTPQKAYFNFTEGALMGLSRVYLEQDGNFVADIVPDIRDDGTISWDTQNSVLNVNNIFCDNIDIRFSQKVNLTETLFYPWISTPYGDALYDAGYSGANSVGRASVQLVAHLQHGYQDILDPETCQVLWFKEDTRVTMDFVEQSEWEKDDHNKTAYDYGGDGWYPIDLMIKEGDLNYDVDFDTLTIRKEAVPFKNNYKAVIVYRDMSTTEQKEIANVEVLQEVVRLDSRYDLELLQENDQRKILLHVVDHNKPYDKVDPNTGENYREWFATWWVKTQSGAYFQISNGPVQGAFAVNDFLLDNMATFYAQCYDPYIVDPDNTGSAVMQDEHVAILTKVVITAAEGDLLLDWVGNTQFNYDALGTIRDGASDTDHTLIPVVKFVDGRAADYRMTVFAPDGTPLSNKKYYDEMSSTGSGMGYMWKDTSGNNRCMLKNMWVEDMTDVIHFQVEPQYHDKRSAPDLNQFTIKIELYTGQTYELKKTITFTKDGDQGTIGGDWIAPIKPCNWKYGPDKEEGPYIEPLDVVAPLVVNLKADGSMEQDPHYRVFLRPFAAKKGTPLENLDPFEGYFVKVYWDVRMPESAARQDVKLASFLRFRHTNGDMDINNPGSIYGRQKSWYETGNIELGTDTIARQKWSSKVNDLEHDGSENGLVAFTMFPRKQYENETAEFATENYGAVEVRFFDNAAFGTGADMESMMYRFIVKAQVDIMKGQYDQQTKMIRTEGNIERIHSITSYYPIDILINREGIDFWNENDLEYYEFNKKIATNWPRWVMYNASGYDPANLVDPLYFKYGNRLMNEEVNYKAYNLTPLTQTLRLELDPSTQIMNQYYEAKNHINFVEGFHGALIFEPTEPGPFGSGTYIRNQIMYLNPYGNVDINGWDGQGIDMNEKDGTIFASTIGAGYKTPQTNAFTGVLMGVDRSQVKKDVGGYAGSYDDEAHEHQKYMTGLFGYQDGVNSFALMENGTAFFGRADRGGRIIIDGANATIYGGANGIMDSPTIGDPMWNTMRLSLVDLNHSTSQLGKNVDGYYVYNFDGKYYEKNPDGTFSQIAEDDKRLTEQAPIFTGIKNGEKGFITQGFDGKYFTMDTGMGVIDRKTLPKWYQHLWKTAYVKPDGGLPYWLQDSNKKQIDTAYDNLEWYVDHYDMSDPDTTLPYKTEQNYKIDYFGDPDHPEEMFGKLFKAKADRVNDEDSGLNVLNSEQLSGFGPSRASTTPAIEVGQHLHGLMPGLIPWSEYKNVFRELAIPGDRNFLVTYDGTLWAMNGVFMGAVIGSNIIGGRIQGSEIGIGEAEGSPPAIWTVQKRLEPDADPECRFEYLMPPLDVYHILDLPGNVAFYVDTAGNVQCRSIAIYGGSIDMGRFHIVGKDENDPNFDDAEYGHLIQVAESDFIGPTHFYGNVGIGPSLRDSVQGMGNYGSSRGNLLQTHGIVAMGIPLPGSVDVDIHQELVTMLRDERIDYNAEETGYGHPNIGRDASIEQMAFFGIDSASEDIPLNAGDEGKFQGHFWPMHFQFGGGLDNQPASGANFNSLTNAYMTTMDIFKSEAYGITTGTGGETINGSNYFRVGPFGTEAMVMYIRKNWQSEVNSRAPRSDNGPAQGGQGDEYSPDAYLGWFGLQNRAGYSEDGKQGKVTQFSLGITSWYTAPIIFDSDGESAWLTRGHMHFLAQEYGGNTATDETSKDAGAWGTFFNMGASYNRAATDTTKGDGNQIALRSQKGGIEISVHNHKGGKVQAAFNNPWTTGTMFRSEGDMMAAPAGIKINPMAHINGGSPNGKGFLGIWLANPDGAETEMHIVHKGNNQGKSCTDSKSCLTEILLDKENIYMYARKKIVMFYGKEGSAHELAGSEGAAPPNLPVIDSGEGGTNIGVPLDDSKKICIFLGEDGKGNSEISWFKGGLIQGGPVVRIGGGGQSTHTMATGGGNFFELRNGQIDMMGAYAVPDNQFHIYARFG